MFGEATPEERRRYYTEEWSPKELPEFIVRSLSMREFGFDHSGDGPSDRYNRIASVAQLQGMLTRFAPYGVYSSVSLYRTPERREGWLGAELVFDVDAKDLPVRGCECSRGEVCSTCLEEAKQHVLGIAEVLRDDFALSEMHFVYSGRGYHLRVTDEEVMQLGSRERAEILDYVAAGVLPETPELGFGYPAHFRRRMRLLLPRLSEALLREAKVPKRAREVLLSQEGLREVLEGLEKGTGVLARVLKKKGTERLMELVRRINAEMVDAKVTVDVKRILRLPSSLHSKVSMKCMLVRKIESFDPLSQAVPRFVSERESKGIYKREI